MGLVRTLDRGFEALDTGIRFAAERLETGMNFNPMEPGMFADPHPFYRELRERDPIHRSRPADGWVLSRFEDVHAVLADRSFSSDERNLRRWKRLLKRRTREGLPDPYATDRFTMLRADAPDHTRMRSLVNQAFTPRAVQNLRLRIEEVVDELMRPLQRSSRCELVADFAGPLPVVVIAEMLGIPSGDRDRFRHLSDEVVRGVGDGTREDAFASEAAHDALCVYLRTVAEERRREPREDLISALVAVEQDGQRLTMDELLGTVVLLLVAGNETTTKLICNSVIELLNHPEQLAILRDEPKRIAAAIDELLRFAGPVQLTSRMVTEDRNYRGYRFQRGQQLVLLLASANRDPEQFAEPDRLDVTRENVRHLALGYGAHFCLGAQLARLETTLALEALIERLPDMSFGEQAIEWGNNVILRGPKSLHLSL